MNDYIIKKLRRQKVYLMITIAAVVLSVLGAVLLSVPIPVERTIHAIEIKQNDPSYCVEREVTIQGVYNLNLLRPHRYSGTLSISGYEETVAPNQLWPIYFYDCDLLRYYWEEQITGSPRNEQYEVWRGVLYSEFDFQNAAIIVGIKGEDGRYSYRSDTQPIIVFGATDREDAMERVEKIIVTPHG